MKPLKKHIQHQEKTLKSNIHVRNRKIPFLILLRLVAPEEEDDTQPRIPAKYLVPHGQCGGRATGHFARWWYIKYTADDLKWQTYIHTYTYICILCNMRIWLLYVLYLYIYTLYLGGEKIPSKGIAIVQMSIFHWKHHKKNLLEAGRCLALSFFFGVYINKFITDFSLAKCPPSLDILW